MLEAIYLDERLSEKCLAMQVRTGLAMGVQKKSKKLGPYSAIVRLTG